MGDIFDQVAGGSKPAPSGDIFEQVAPSIAPSFAPPPGTPSLASAPRGNVNPEYVGFISGRTTPADPTLQRLGQMGAGVIDQTAHLAAMTPTVLHRIAQRSGLTGPGSLPGEHTMQQVQQQDIPNAVAMVASGLGGEEPVPTVRQNAPAPKPSTPTVADQPSLASIMARHVPVIGRGLRMMDTIEQLKQLAGIGKETSAPAPSPVPETGGVPWGTGGQGPVDLRGKMIPQPPDITVHPMVQQLQEAAKRVNPETAPQVVTLKPSDLRAASDAAFAKNYPNDQWVDKMDPLAQRAWQESAFGQKGIEDIGAKARNMNPEPTRAEVQAARVQTTDTGKFTQGRGATVNPPMEPASGGGSETVIDHGYHPDTRTMVVRFKPHKAGGLPYKYEVEGVPQEIYNQFRNAPSQGSYYQENIKGRYSTFRVKDRYMVRPQK